MSGEGRNEDVRALSKLLHWIVCGDSGQCSWFEDDRTCADVGATGLEGLILDSEWLAGYVARHNTTARTSPPALAADPEALAKALHPLICTTETAPADGPPPDCLAVARALLASGAVLPAAQVEQRARDEALVRFRAAAELTVQDVRAQRGDRIASIVEDSFVAHLAAARGGEGQ